MAFTDYLDLRTAVIEQVQRPDIADVFDRLTRLAEARFNRELRLRQQVKSASLTIADGAASLPSDYLEAIGLYGANGREYSQRPLQAVRPRHCTYFAVDASQIKGADGDRTLEYYGKIPSLTDPASGWTFDSDQVTFDSGTFTFDSGSAGGDVWLNTNWLLEEYPEVYLYGVSTEAAKYLRDIEGAQAFGALRDMALAEAESNDARARFSRARVRVKGLTP